MRTATRNGQPSPAGGMEVRALRGPTRRGVLFFWTGRGPFVSGLSAAAYAAVGLRHAPAGAVFLSRTKRKWGVDSSDKVGTTQPADWLPLQGIEFNKNTVQCIESGNRFVTDLELKAIAQVLGVTADELLSE